MNLRQWTSATGALLAAAIFVTGCGKTEDKGGAQGVGLVTGGATPAGTDRRGAANRETKHDTWWCDEHGVPEHECSMCSAKAARACKAKGDWCKAHKRAKSQCFICDPSLREKYAVQYRAKYGKEPPEPWDNMPPKDGETKKGS
jgi:hypothetical protein